MGGGLVWGAEGAIGWLRRTLVRPSIHLSVRRRDGPSGLPFKRQPSPILFPPAKEKSAGGVGSDWGGGAKEERGGACGNPAGLKGGEGGERKKVANTKGSSLLVLTKWGCGGRGGGQRERLSFLVTY